jgi:hypothetical protein
VAGDIIVAIDRFIKSNIGEVVQVFHELASDDLHIDIHHGRTTGDIPYQWLFTSGMSRMPMNVPRGTDAQPFAELLICLPPEWPLDMGALKNENYYWPIRLLKMLARYPHLNNSWLHGGHSVPYGKPFAANTRMSEVVLAAPHLLFSEPAVYVRDKKVLLWAVYPLYPEELAYKNNNGFAALEDLFAEHGISEALNPRRISVVTRVM